MRKKLVESEPQGVLAYTPLLLKLDDCNGDTNCIREVATKRITVSLLCALQEDTCLQDIRQVVQRYPDLKLMIYECALKLRQDKKLKNWAEHESQEYKDFVASLAIQ